MDLWAAIDILGGSVVTLRKGLERARTTWPDEPTKFAARWEREGADGLHIIDLDAAFGKGSNTDAIKAILKSAKIPVQVGGGVRTGALAESWLQAGASRVILGTLAYAEPESLSELLRRAGAERVVVAADYAEGRVVTKGWTTSQGVGVVEAAKRLERMGVVNLLATAVGQDGTGEGPDLETTRMLCESTRMNVIASGGIRDVADLGELSRRGARGAVLGRALYEGTIDLKGARS